MDKTNLNEWWSRQGHLARVWTIFLSIGAIGVILSWIPVIRPLGLLIGGLWIFVVWAVMVYSFIIILKRQNKIDEAKKEKDELERDQRLAKMIAEENKKKETKE